MSYTPPSPLSFDFTVAYTPPSQPVVFNFGATIRVYSDGINEAAFGTAGLSLRTITQAGGIPPSGFGTSSVVLKNRYLLAIGCQPGSVGTPLIYLKTRYLLAGSWQSSILGTPAVVLKTRRCIVGSIAPPPQTGVNSDRQIPSPIVDYRTKILTPEGITAPAFISTHHIADYYQFVDLTGTGVSGEAFGNALVAYRYRSVEPYFIASNIFGTPSVTFKLVVALSGWSSSAVSESHLLEINTRRLRHNSGDLDPARYGETSIRNRIQRVSVEGIFPEGLGFPVVWNRKQHVVAGAYENTYADPTLWPPYAPYVANKNRTLVTQGHRSSRFSALGHGVRNKARALVPEGISSIRWGEATDVGHRIRYLLPAPVTDGYLSPYAIVYNKARVISFTIPQTSSVGVPSLVNRNRYLPVSSITSSNVFGVPFTAFRIRYLAAYSCPTIFTPIPGIRLNPYPIPPLGIPPCGFGRASFYTQYNGISVSATNVHRTPWIGRLSIENRNKSILGYLYDQSEFGLNKIENRIKYVAVGNGPQTLWGVHGISRRTKVLTQGPISTPVFPVLHRIRNVIPDPPGTQIVLAPSVFIGSELNTGYVAFPFLSPYPIRPSGINMSGFGLPKLTVNLIRTPRGIFNMDQVGVPSVSGTQYCYLEGFLESDLQWGAVRLSPHTIYAPSSDRATQQARDNHPINSPHRIGELGSTFSNWPIFGSPAISNKNRIIGPVPRHRIEENQTVPALHTRYGSADVQLRRRYLFAQGIRPRRFGFAAILGGVQFVDLNDPSVGIAPLPIVTAHQVGPPYEAPLPVLRPDGLAPPVPTGVRVEFLNRTLAPEGIRHRGNPEQDLTSPWGQAHIGPPVPLVIGGGVMTLWGTAVVEYLHRTVSARGFESLSLVDYTLSGFANRMRVRRRNPAVVVLPIAAPSFSSPVVGHV